LGDLLFLLRFFLLFLLLLSLPNNVWRLIVFAPFLIIIIIILLSFRAPCFYPPFLCRVLAAILKMADILKIFKTQNCSSNGDLSLCQILCKTEFHETWWSYRYMFVVDPSVFRFVVKGVKAIFMGVQKGCTYQILMISDNVEFLPPIFMPCFGSHFENGRHLENFENAELLL
jgi:hypothetical protein